VNLLVRWDEAHERRIEGQRRKLAPKWAKRLVVFSVIQMAAGVAVLAISIATGRTWWSGLIGLLMLASGVENLSTNRAALTVHRRQAAGP
jgi:phosphoribosylcarboxyaminoimidazole (NCAIR) mutase